VLDTCFELSKIKEIHISRLVWELTSIENWRFSASSSVSSIKLLYFRFLRERSSRPGSIDVEEDNDYSHLPMAID